MANHAFFPWGFAIVLVSIPPIQSMDDLNILNFEHVLYAFQLFLIFQRGYNQVLGDQQFSFIIGESKYTYAFK